ncbi:MAG: ABC transporter permease subunit [Gammaproteobacteria bacterium]|nr:ABC transporter permease subunit [Gammaproteobacteria bacterium]MCH9744369.1 ABC transporter permease subunit [Gammaproteobacteria bacterium]
MSLNIFNKNEATSWPIPNYWDMVALILVMAVIVLLGWGAKAMLGQYHLGQQIPISLDVSNLPYYSLRTVLRMLIALVCSLVFTFVFGAWAAKSRQAERLIIPIIDILQSVPVIGFLTIAVANLVVVFNGSMLGPELASIFAIFTAQVWNMALSFYQSLKTMPKEMDEAARMFQLSAWQKFWRVEVPFAMPGLLWNTMMSMSSSWIFLVASEAITVANQNITLPGVGSYLALAISKANMHAVIYVIITMVIVIALYDQLLFRPLVAWSEKFKVEEGTDDDVAESWLLNLFQRADFFQYIGTFFAAFGDIVVNFKLFRKRAIRRRMQVRKPVRLMFVVAWNLIILAAVLVAAYILWHYIFASVSLHEAIHVVFLGSITALRVFVLIIVSSIIWVPVGVWVGLNPRLSQIVQPIAQFLAAFPANLLFPLFVIMIQTYHLNVNIWTSPLMLLGTQWFILFNVIAGTLTIPKNLKQAVGTLNVRGWLWWKRLVLPAVFPYYITGAITAAGGAWNVSILAEVISWGHTTLRATGLGAYLDRVTAAGDFPRETLGIVVMSIFVLVINHLVWRPLYNLAEQKYKIK